jgi:hypothetical protein
MTDWYPEGGFYETRAKQGESDWEDQANYDPPLPTTTEDMRDGHVGRAGGVLSTGDLTKEESYAFESGKIYGS